MSTKLGAFLAAAIVDVDHPVADGVFAVMRLSIDINRYFRACRATGNIQIGRLSS